MLSLVDEFPLAVVPPGLLIVGWLVLSMTTRRVGWWLALSGLGLTLLCLLAGVLIELVQPPCDNPHHDTWACGLSVPLVTGLLSAVLTAGCTVVLLVVGALLRLTGVTGGRR